MENNTINIPRILFFYIIFELFFHLLNIMCEIVEFRN